MALGLLLWLRLRGWVRRLGRGMRTVRGALLAVIGGMMMLFWFGSLLVNQFLPGRETDPVELEQVRLYGPLFLFAYCVLTATTTAGERAISFTPAETSMLFPGPFTRRQLLLYKIANSLLVSLITTLIFTFVMRRFASSFGTAFVGLLLAMTLMQFFPMVLVLIGETIGSKAFKWQRRMILLAVGGFILLAVLMNGNRVTFEDAGDFFHALATSPAVQAALTPFRWFVDVYTAEQVWPDAIVAVGLCLLVNGLLFGVILALDAHYLESAATASEKLYAKLQRLRTGGAAAAWAMGASRFSIPSFPYLGGVGPIGWRQAVAFSRGLRGLVFFLVIMFVCMLVPTFMGFKDTDIEADFLPIMLAGSLLTLSLVTLPMMLTFDFRGDVDRIEVLKTLPLAAWRIVLGQLLTPVLVTTLLQILVCLILQTVWGGIATLLLAVAVFGAPINFLFYAIENLMFLWFPTRTNVGGVADFQLMGRHALLFFAKFLLFSFTLGASALVGGIVFMLSQSLTLAGAGALPVVLAVDMAMIPLLTTAFKQFDVARDTPA